MQVFGRNLWIRSRQSTVMIQHENNKPVKCNILTSHENELLIEMPIGHAQGSYKLWVHNGSGGQYGWSQPVTFTSINYPYSRGTYYNVEDMTGPTDQQKITQAIALARAVGGGHVVLADKSVKTYTITADVYLPIQYESDTVKPIFLEGPEFGEAHIQATGTERAIIIASAGSELRNTKLTGVRVAIAHKDVVINNCEITLKNQAACITTFYTYQTGRFNYQNDMNALIKNCTFRGENVGAAVYFSNIKFLNCDFYGRYKDGLYNADGTLDVGGTAANSNLDNHGITTRESANRVIVEGCTFQSENVAMGRILTRAIACMGQGDSQHVFKNNVIRWCGAFDTASPRSTNTGEQILFHGGESAIRQLCTGTSTETTVTIDMTFAAWTAHNFGTLNETYRIEDKRLWVQVLSGDAKGQIRLVTGASGTTTTVLTVEPFQNVVPLAGDSIGVSVMSNNHVIFGNDIDPVPIPSAVAVDFGRAGIQFWSPQHSSVVNENIIKRCGSGVVVTNTPSGLWTQGPLYIRNNTITDGLAGGPYGHLSPSCVNIMSYYEYAAPDSLQSFGNVIRDNIFARTIIGVEIGSLQYDIVVIPRNDATFVMNSQTGQIHTLVEHNNMTDMILRTAGSLNMKYAIGVGANWLLMRNNIANSAQVKAVFDLAKTHESVLIVANVVIP